MRDLDDYLKESGLSMQIECEPFRFSYGLSTFGPDPELRCLDDIRSSLLNPNCTGPDPVYAIAMDVLRRQDEEIIRKHSLLFGVIAYAAGRLGKEPVRSQGHVHAISPASGSSTPELIEIWSGRAAIYLQEFVRNDSGRCFVIEASPGDQVVIPPGWAHFIVNADSERYMAFGAWCVRDYKFCYDEIRARGGLAWFPIMANNGEISWQPNDAYLPGSLSVHPSRGYPELGVDSRAPIYSQVIRCPERFTWIVHPKERESIWRNFLY